MFKLTPFITILLQKSVKGIAKKLVGKVKGNVRYGLIEWKEEFFKAHPELENFDVYTSKNGLEFKARDLETNNVINPVKIEKNLQELPRL